ncbi:MAG: hypothetical protein JJ892_09610 [Balneola sp.]|nr:hypothetical protein [Balneola sp.]MBO6649765.1 hypothetical protein [Balneola sp.]MBO6712328.1 hypothetical protein [Balneola sp.]MBO6800522.1 hypothetical protein [Balneola sp.]MBO6871476.1 hypothetical protein [Balneola sp.]
METTMKKVTGFILAVFLTTSFSFAQNAADGSKPQGENLKVPDGWEWRFDKADAEVSVGSDSESADVFFVNMTPGWHITTGPAGIYYHADNKAEGDFTLDSKIYLFDTKGRNREAFGLFIGGQNLKSDDQSYVYFLLRNTGEFLIKKRTGSETSTINGWTKTDAMNMFTEETESSAENDFQVKVVGDEIVFSLNGEVLSSLEKGDLNTDGHYGFRVNHSINLHISSLKLFE